MPDNHANKTDRLTTATPIHDKSMNLKTEKPGNTLLVLDLARGITDIELKSSFNTHGVVDRVLLTNDSTSALIEFSSNSTSSNLVYNSKITPFKIGSHVVRLFFSCQTIDEYKSISKPNIGRHITKVLHFLITNAVYAITVDVLNKICTPYGKVIRIYIGKKNEIENNIEALIEFATDNDSKIVKDNLDGNDIYSGCCSLKLSYSKIHKIHVEKNDNESCDYTIVPKTGLLGPPPSDPPVIMNSHFPTYIPPMPMPYSIPPMFSPPPLYSLPYPIPPPFNYNPNIAPSVSDKKKQSNSNTNNLHYKNDSTIQETVEGVVLLLTNLSSKIKPENIFNLFCLYGNVEKIKMGPETGSNSAFVQMSNREAADFCLMILNGVSVFNRPITVSPSNCPDISDTVPNSDPMQLFYSDFYNRFKPNFSSKSKINVPSPTLHFFNVPSTFTAEEIADVFISAKVKDPSQVVIFPRKSSLQRGSLVTGLIEFDSTEEATEGVVMVNHTRLLLPQVSHPFHIKLSFSPARISEQHILRSTAGDGAQMPDGDRAGSGGGTAAGKRPGEAGDKLGAGDSDNKVSRSS